MRSMDGKPVPDELIKDIKKVVINLPDFQTWADLKAWIMQNRPPGEWSMRRIFEAQADYHAEYLDRELTKL